MFQRRATTGRRKISGVRSIRRDTYNSNSGFSQKNGWWEINALVVKRSGGQCEAYLGGRRCNNRGKEVHHIVPLSRGGRTTMTNLIHICAACHDARHNHLYKQNRK